MKIDRTFIFCILFIFLNVQSTKIRKSLIDLNTYEYNTLPNGMKIITISNPKADIAGCSMTVGVGSQNDLIDTPGIAHFLEHMLFMGTKEYPDETEFTKYIEDHNGSYNAATSDEHTVFYYSINPKHLEDSLKRFSSFFKYPLLKEDSIKREILAVDSEYQMKLKNDDRRIYQMINNC
ncbi:A-factor-processing enzyme, partial [Astathelohania contejeani]